MSDKPVVPPVVDKPVDKSVVVLCRMEPTMGHFEEAKKLSEEWHEFLKTMPDCKNIDVICCVETQIAWLEGWTSQMAMDKFNEEHFAYADYLVRMVACSRKVPTRYVYRRLG
ncbi:MAG TPA: hypothetical protein VLB90_00220 [Pseudomonadales bacterium]|nr:hypothetical protein [Pseudomonadales bacterium]